MKKLLVIFLLFNSYNSFCQDGIWNGAPEQIIDIFNKNDSQMISQKVDGSQLWISFQSARYKGITTTYYFVSEKLKNIYFEYNIAIFIPPAPTGQKVVLRTGEVFWADYENKQLTIRKYRTGEIVDIISRLK